MGDDSGRIERLAEVLARSTEALVGARDESSLLEDICRIGAETGGFPLVWIGAPHPEGQGRVRRAAAAGPAENYLERVRPGMETADSRRGPPARALYEGVTTVVEDTARDPIFAPWADAAAAFGLKSSIALPVGEGENRQGVLCFYAGRPGTFDALSQRLLAGLARNLALGLASLRMKSCHDRTARELAESEERYRSLIESAPDAGLVHELSQPLNIIRLAAEGALMLIERGKASPDWQAQQFQLISEQSERAAEIIDGIHIFSRRDTTPLHVFGAMDAVASAVDVLQSQMRHPVHGTFTGSHILVVEDETLAADALALYLRALGCRVSVAPSGEAAWGLFRRDPADVVITDSRMPAGDGEPLVEKLRDFDPLLPIVIVTGHLGATERLAESLQDDRCAVLKKPVALDGLSELIARFLHPPEQ